MGMQFNGTNTNTDGYHGIHPRTPMGNSTLPHSLLNLLGDDDRSRQVRLGQNNSKLFTPIAGHQIHGTLGHLR